MENINKQNNIVVSGMEIYTNYQKVIHQTMNRFMKQILKIKVDSKSTYKLYQVELENTNDKHLDRERIDESKSKTRKKGRKNSNNKIQ